MRRAPLGLLLGSLAIAAALAPAFAGAQQVVLPSGPPLVPHVQSSGRGEVRVTPDHAIVTAVVDTRGDTAVSVAAENTRRYDALLQGVRGVGVQTQQISSPGYTVTSGPGGGTIGFATTDVYVPMTMTTGTSRSPMRLPSASVRRTVRIDPVRMSDVDRVVQAALAAGATQVSVQLAAPSLENAQRAAFSAAVSDARSNADAMARAAGGSLSRLVDISTNFTPSGGVISYASVPYEGTSFGGITPITVRDVTVVAIVSARWELSTSPASTASK